MRKKLLIGGIIVLAILLSVLVFRQRATAPVSPQVLDSTPIQPLGSTAVRDFDKTVYSIGEPTALWVIVNKVSPLPADFVPSDLTSPKIGGYIRKSAAEALDKMVAAAKNDKVNLRMISGYRSYSSQRSVYDGYVARDGQKAADTYSARPGTSEHQTGWAVDLGGSSCDLEVCFAGTAEGKWLAAHAHKYGFTIRYPEGKQTVTGYQYEPWHLRYVGTGLAVELQKSGQTMEEFFNVVPSAQPY